MILDVLLDALRCLMMFVTVKHGRFKAGMLTTTLRLQTVAPPKVTDAWYAVTFQIHRRCLISVWDRPVHVWVHLDPLHLYICSQNHCYRCEGLQCDVAKLLQGSFYKKKAFPGSWLMFPMNKPLKKAESVWQHLLWWRLENRFAATFGVLVSENA